MKDWKCPHCKRCKLTGDDVVTVQCVCGYGCEQNEVGEDGSTK